MKLTMPVLAEGGLAGIFSHADPGTVVKVFRRHVFTHDPIKNPLDHEAVSRAICHAEMSAYELLQKDADLRAFAPVFLGQVTIQDISDVTGKSVLANYIPDCAYVMEYVKGSDQKLSSLSPQLTAEVGIILQKFVALGIRYTVDASCFSMGTTIKLIDFGTWDAHGELSDMLAFQGELRSDVRQRWSRPLG